MDIFSYIEAENPAAAAELDEKFTRVADRLVDFPYIGRPELIPGTREFIPHENYRLVYEVRENTVYILAVVHTSRQWLPPAEEARH